MPPAFRLTAFWLTVLISAICASLAAADDKGPAASRDALADLVIAGPNPPLRLRLVVTCEGQLWRDYAPATNQKREESLFEQLDSNNDDTLSELEARRLPADAWSQPGAGNGQPVPFVAFNFRALDADDDASATRSEFSGYVAIPATAAFRVSRIDRNQLAPGRRLFALLDANRDGWLAKAEWSAPPDLFRNDQNGDRLLTGDELTKLANWVFESFHPGGRALSEREREQGPHIHCLIAPLGMSLVSHGSVATAVSLYGDEGRPFGRESCHFVQLMIGS